MTAGLRALRSLAEATAAATPVPADQTTEARSHVQPISQRRRRPEPGRGRDHRGIRGAVPPPMATRQEAGGALAGSYDIPDVELVRRHVRGYVAVAALLCAAGVARH